MAAIIEEAEEIGTVSPPTEAEYNFFRMEGKTQFFTSRDANDALLQWNLDKCTLFEKYRFTGVFAKSSFDEYEKVLKQFFCNPGALGAIGITGSATVPVEIECTSLGLSVMSMDFFDRLSETIAPRGNIRGCYEESFDGISVGDQLREFLLNDYSENADLYTASEKNELIFRLFKILAVGGSMCQPDDKIQRYIEMTKNLYKEFVTVYKDSKTNEIKVAGKVFEIRKVSGLNLFPEENSSQNNLYIMIDPVKKEIRVLKKDFIPFW